MDGKQVKTNETAARIVLVDDIFRAMTHQVQYMAVHCTTRMKEFNLGNFPVEVGSRGFVAYSLMRCLRQLGFPPYWAKKVRNEASKVSLRCSYLIYLRRNIRVWQERLGD